MVVYDPQGDILATKNLAQTTQVLQQAQQQTSTLANIQSLYSDAQKMITQVTGAVNDFFKIKSIVQSSLNCVKLSTYYSNKANGFKYCSQARIATFNTLLATLSATVNDLVKHADNLLQTNYFKMSDADRINNLNKTNEELDDQQVLMELEYKQLESEEKAGAIDAFFSYNY
jgi:hypothetical protein